ncbi:phosphomevalonate kinase [Nocardia sp. NPDC020380]|uniref:phosphomevalonate kinase n=1 Tax=Nocardia sp. NPDC020380 TaxID=3364309 RepID=UPI0037A244C7
MIEVRVPGKLFIAGEYAVLEPGGAAVLVAVDRFVTARLIPRTDHRITVISTVTHHRPVEITHGHPDPRLALVLAAIDVCHRLVTETGSGTTGFDLTIESELDDITSGIKFGLGSSGAVTIAVVRALSELYDLGSDTDRTLKLALLAAISVDPSGSGGDLAASLLGGWVAYTAPDRDHYAEQLHTGRPIASLLDTPWPHLSAVHVPAPRELHLLAGWTGSAVSTRNLVADFRSRMNEAHHRFVADSNTCVAALVTALRSGDDTAVSHCIEQSARILHTYTSSLNLDLQTPVLTALRHLAHNLGIAAKSSGAGGGDCGIALAPSPLIPALAAAWHTAGIHSLNLTVADRRSSS